MFPSDRRIKDDSTYLRQLVEDLDWLWRCYNPQTIWSVSFGTLICRETNMIPALTLQSMENSVQLQHSAIVCSEHQHLHSLSFARHHCSVFEPPRSKGTMLTHLAD